MIMFGSRFTIVDAQWYYYYEELEKLAKETEKAAGYKRVVTPNIAKESMYLTSGAFTLLC